jgi:hypothetical protein
MNVVGIRRMAVALNIMNTEVTCQCCIIKLNVLERTCDNHVCMILLLVCSQTRFHASAV